ncbi:GNAT family N-acetyltransferase [Amnibacterium endophyticum]|uniref:GNAT family N-acetyltransferase n=1 Tax=Amnibacterium endophyticum TaxID=2109337 RepID=A0ABW4LC06_9MICO
MEVRAATEVPWSDVEGLFADGGDPSTCSCQWFRMSGPAFEALSDSERRDRLRAECAGPEPGPGVVALRDDVPVGWCGVGPMSGYPRLGRSPLLRGTSADWAVTCFVVPERFRRQGIARALIAGAVDHARASGADSLVAVPVDVAARPAATAAELYHGPLALFLEAGFTEVARPSAARAVVRLDL